MGNKLSLLYKNANKKLNLLAKPPEFIKDLKLDGILEFMSYGNKNINSKRVIASVLSELCEDTEDIKYRADILQEFIQKPQMFLDLLWALAKLISVERDLHLSNRRRTDVSAEYKLGKGIGMLLGYCGICKEIDKVLKQHGDSYSSEGLSGLSKMVSEYVENDGYNKLESILIGLKKCVKGYAKIKLKASLGTSFKLKEAMVLDLDSNGFFDNDLEEDKLIKEDLSSRLKKLLKVDRENKNTYAIKKINYILKENSDEIKDKIFTNIAQIIEVMIYNVSSFLRNITEEILFYEGALKLVNEMKNLGLTTSWAEVVPQERRSMLIEGMYDLSFALYLSDKGCLRPLDSIVTNDVCISGQDRIQVITGPNQGGKTTYIRAIGIIQVLAQAGIPVPASKAVISPVDQLFTHFPVEERPESNEGRLGEELGRMLLILENATPNSLVFINEAFASTNSREGSLIAQDVMSALAVIGAKCFFVTHLYELAIKLENINKGIESMGEGYGQLISMTAQFEENSGDSGREEESGIRRSYKILPGVPSKSSFAADIAAQFGIRYIDFG
ncbi:MAG: Endonuclease MutS2 [Firmicutes bacterium ADurb.Bin419]|nr:MAG: Endonuclease MutS2 [Firmicutes bacterium ADurb.Bin419]